MEGEHTPTIIQLILSTDLTVIQLKNSHLILHISSYFLTKRGDKWNTKKSSLYFQHLTHDHNEDTHESDREHRHPLDEDVLPMFDSRKRNSMTSGFLDENSSNPYM